MENKETLIEYIRSNLSRGVPRGDLETVLRAGGWSPKDIIDAFATLVPTPQSESVPAPYVDISRLAPEEFVGEMERRRKFIATSQPLSNFSFISASGTKSTFSARSHVTIESTGITGFLIRKGVVSTPAQANAVLAGVLVVVVVLIVWMNWPRSAPNGGLTPAQLNATIEKMSKHP